MKEGEDKVGVGSGLEQWKQERRKSQAMVKMGKKGKMVDQNVEKGEEGGEVETVRVKSWFNKIQADPVVAFLLKYFEIINLKKED